MIDFISYVSFPRPMVVIFNRQTDNNLINWFSDKITIPKECTIFVSPFITQRIPEIYPDPHNFNPTRFDTEKVLKRHPYSFIPFSAGPRNCIGYKFSLIEMKTIISTILRQYRLEPTPGKEDLVLTWRITIRARGGIWLRLIPRNDVRWFKKITCDFVLWTQQCSKADVVIDFFMASIVC